MGTMRGQAVVALDDEGIEPDRDVLGGKGAGLVRMARLGLPVPPAFILGTGVGRAYLRGRALPEAVHDEVERRLADLERATGRRLGDPDAPLLVSVRSGASVSMPGMMDTVLNVGLNDEVVEGLAAQSGDARFAWAAYERLVAAYARTVRGVAAEAIEQALVGAEGDGDPIAALRGRTRALQLCIEAESGEPFPAEAGTQVRECVEAAFRSWESKSARAYRSHCSIDSALGTAAVVQAMVFGSRGEHSGSGVAFSRDPATGEPGGVGELLFGAQGEDVVSGLRDPEPLTVLDERLPAIADELRRMLELLERDERDLCELQFTIEQERLWVLQARAAPRGARAAVRTAVELCEAGLIDREEALARLTDEQLAACRAPRFETEAEAASVVGRGQAASSGAAVGVAAFDPGRAQSLAAAGADVVLVRPTTVPGDAHGLVASVAAVIGRGGVTSHAAVVARGLGRPAVCGVGPVEVAADGRSAVVAGTPLREGEPLAVDGDRGLVARDPAALAEPEPDRWLEQLEGWREEAA